MFNIAEISLTVGIITALTLVLLRVFGDKLTAKCKYVVWTIVIVRLCIPVGFFGLSPLLEISISEELATVLQRTDENVEDSPEDPSVSTSKIHGDNNNMVSGTAPLLGYEAENDEYLPDTSAPNISDGKEFAEDNFGVIESFGQPVSDNTFDVIYTADIITAIGIIWFVGVLIHLSLHIISYALCSNRLKRSTKLAEPDAKTVEVYERLAREMGLERVPVLKVCGEPISPLLFGYFEKTVIIPDLEFTSEYIYYILKHELIHYRRGDVVIKLLCCVAQAIHWFNPLVYTAVLRCMREMEQSCDEAVLVGAAEEARISYGEAILQVARRNMTSRISALTMSFYADECTVKNRLKNILNVSKKHKGTGLIAALTVLCIISGAFVGCSVREDGVSDSIHEVQSSTDTQEDAGSEDTMSDVIIPDGTATDDNFADDTDEPKETESETYAETLEGNDTDAEDVTEESETADRLMTEPEASTQTHTSHEYITVAIYDNGCTSYQTGVYRCTFCGEEETVTLDVLGAHSYVLTENTEPTCWQKGRRISTCEGCGDVIVSEVETIEHDMQEKTCTAPATCKTCGMTVGEAMGHDFADATVNVPRTCRSCGATEGEALSVPCVDTESFKNTALLEGYYYEIPESPELSCYLSPTYFDAETKKMNKAYIISAVQIFNVDYSVLVNDGSDEYTVTFDCTAKKFYDKNAEGVTSDEPAYMSAVVMNTRDHSYESVLLPYSGINNGDTFTVSFALELAAGDYKIYFRNVDKAF